MKGDKGFVELAGTFKEADPKSQSVGDDANQWLKNELAKSIPDSSEILGIFAA
ncbi:MAG TPA: hypothetical protein VFI27_02135 [candidate division Zixibacteria bacterium]|nr:hypothetical protein [candidate division Zixibacteria bacterium]